MICLGSCALSLAEEKPAVEQGKAPWNKPIVGADIELAPFAREDVQAKTEAIPQKYAAEKAVAIKLENLKPVGERLMMKAVLRIINPTDKPMMFTGYSAQAPILKVQHLKDGKWAEEQKGPRCGTGLRKCTIAPGQSAVFEAAVYAETMPTRIGIAYSSLVEPEGSPPRNAVVWSEKIER